MSRKKILNIDSSYIFAQVYKIFYIDFRKITCFKFYAKQVLV